MWQFTFYGTDFAWSRFWMGICKFCLFFLVYLTRLKPNICLQNSFGQLGIDNCTHQTTPVQVKLPKGVTVKSIACGMNHTLLLTVNGEIYAFGKNDWGQLGCPAVPASEGSCSAVKVSCTNRFKVIASDFSSNLSTALSQYGYVSDLIVSKMFFSDKTYQFTL